MRMDYLVHRELQGYKILDIEKQLRFSWFITKKISLLVKLLTRLLQSSTFEFSITHLCLFKWLFYVPESAKIFDNGCPCRSLAYRLSSEYMHSIGFSCYQMFRKRWPNCHISSCVDSALWLLLCQNTFDLSVIKGLFY